MVLRNTTLESLTPSVNTPLVEIYIYIYIYGQAEKYVQMNKYRNM
jgi:hypothetical protein